MIDHLPPLILDRLGRRGLVLLLFGLAWLIQGSAFFVLPGMDAGDDFWVDRLPGHLQGVMWLLSGVLSIAASFMKRGGNDTLGFLAVSAMPMLITTSYLVGIVTHGFFLHDGLWLLACLGFSIWGVITLALAVVASWPEPPEDDA